MTSGSTLRLGLLTYGLDRPLSGIGRYTVELAHALAESRDEIDVTLLSPFAGSAAGLERRYASARFKGRLLPAYMLAGPPQIARLGNRHRLDVVHDPFGVSPFPIPRKAGGFQRVVTIHDMVPFVHPETHARLTNLLFQRYIPATLRFVDRIVTDSEASRRDILRYYQVPESKVTVIPCGVDERFRPAGPGEIDRAIEHYQLPRPYLLTVGALQARKNLETLFDAYRELRAHGWPHRLVVVGKKAWKSEGIFDRLQQLGIEDEVTLTGYVDDDELSALYSGAAAFVFPSLYEGFGLPPLEAMACGTPVVASNTSSLPEVVGDAGIMVDPRDAGQLAQAIERVISDDALSRELSQRGPERARLFSWERAARLHVQLYQELAAESQATATS